MILYKIIIFLAFHKKRGIYIKIKMSLSIILFNKNNSNLNDKVNVPVFSKNSNSKESLIWFMI